jgi:hypothetical protein
MFNTESIVNIVDIGLADHACIKRNNLLVRSQKIKRRRMAEYVRSAIER